MSVQRVPFLRVDRNTHGAEVVTRGAAGTVAGAVFWPEWSVETRDGGNRVVRPAQIAMPYGQPSDPRDQWIVDGLRYEADGAASPFRNPFAPKSARAVISLKRVTG